MVNECTAHTCNGVIEASDGFLLFPAWAPQQVRQYLAHTGAGVSIRELARITKCHASTILRRIQRIEQQRDDPLVDAALRRLEGDFDKNDTAFKQQVKEELKAMTIPSTKSCAQGPDETFQLNAKRILRRLCETGSVLAIAKDMDMAVVLREASDGRATRTAVVSQEVAQAMALRGWIETESKGRILRYRITASGREEVKELIEKFPPQETSLPTQHFAESPSLFEPGQRARDLDVLEPVTKSSRSRYNLAESPLTALSRRKDRGGTPFLSDDLVRCGERLREDFELAQMNAQARMNWDDVLTEYLDHPRKPETANSGLTPDMARTRVVAALKELGPGLSDVVLRCCCYLEGLESAEKHMGWSARSGKIVLRIALQRLVRHYQMAARTEEEMIG